MSTSLRLEAVTRVLGRAGRRRTRALDAATLRVEAGEAVAVLGRSGSGKSTLVGVAAALDRPLGGRVEVDGTDPWAVPGRRRRALRRRIGLVPQDALTAFDPRWTVRQVLEEARRGSGPPVPVLLEQVGLGAALADRAPDTLSGGQRQRVAVARALAVRPGLLLADEPTSGLDLPAQDDLLALLTRVREEVGTTLLLVTHDLRVARRLADRVVVLDAGRVVDDRPVDAVEASEVPATRALVDAVPVLPGPGQSS